MRVATISETVNRVRRVMARYSEARTRVARQVCCPSGVSQKVGPWDEVLRGAGMGWAVMAWGGAAAGGAAGGVAMMAVGLLGAGRRAGRDFLRAMGHNSKRDWCSRTSD